MRQNLLSSISLIVLSGMLVTAAHADAARGKQLYGERCASCHGAAGAGDGPVAMSLPPEMKPANLVTGARKFATDDAKFLELLKKGGAAVGLNVLMPAQADLQDADLTSIISFVKTFKK